MTVDVNPDWKSPPSEPKEPKPLKKGRGFRRSSLASEFRFAVLHEFGGRCILADRHDCEGVLDPCHILPAQTLRNLGFADVVVFDYRNGVAACRRAHRRSDLGLERFPRELLPPSVFEFVAEHGLDWLLERQYPKSVTANDGRG